MPCVTSSIMSTCCVNTTCHPPNTFTCLFITSVMSYFGLSFKFSSSPLESSFWGFLDYLALGPNFSSLWNPNYLFPRPRDFSSPRILSYLSPRFWPSLPSWALISPSLGLIFSYLDSIDPLPYFPKKSFSQIWLSLDYLSWVLNSPSQDPSLDISIPSSAPLDRWPIVTRLILSHRSSWDHCPPFKFTMLLLEWCHLMACQIRPSLLMSL